MQVRQVSQNEVNDVLVAWCVSEGWSPGVNDAKLYYPADPNGFFVGYLNEKPIATLSAVKYGSSYGFIGYYIVEPNFRYKGFGKQIFDEGMKYLQGRTIGLDAVEAQENTYKKSNFKSFEKNHRLETKGGGIFPSNSNLVNLDDVPFDKIVKYDNFVVPFERPEVIKSFINQQVFSFAFYENDVLMGYGILRKLDDGIFKIAPLYADSHEIALLLFLALKSKLSESDTIYIDVPDPNISVFEKFQLNNVFSVVRMYNGDTSIIKSTERVFGITSMEIG